MADRTKQIEAAAILLTTVRRAGTHMDLVQVQASHWDALVSALAQPDGELTVPLSFLQGQIASMERTRPLCPDHRDKMAGPCLGCRIEKAAKSYVQGVEDAERVVEDFDDHGNTESIRSAIHALISPAPGEGK